MSGLLFRLGTSPLVPLHPSSFWLIGCVSQPALFWASFNDKILSRKSKTIVKALKIYLVVIDYFPKSIFGGAYESMFV